MQQQRGEDKKFKTGRDDLTQLLGTESTFTNSTWTSKGSPTCEDVGEDAEHIRCRFAVV